MVRDLHPNHGAIRARKREPRCLGCSLVFYFLFGVEGRPAVSGKGC
jgi:hypothetical protein